MSALADGREAYAQRRWPDAIGLYTAAEQDAELAAGDLERLAISVILTGRGPDGLDIQGRAHLRYLADGDYPAAVRCAAWTGLNLLLLGEPARSAGWLARARRIVDDLPELCPCEGLLSIPPGLGALYQGEGTAALKAFTRAAGLGRKRGDADTAALGTLGLGQTKIMLGQFADGLALLHEAMVAVTLEEISPVPAGIIYCAVIETCRLAFDLNKYVPTLLSRGQSPTDVDSFIAQQYRWCEGSMSLVAADSFHDAVGLTLRQRMSFWSGFLYYMSTAMIALLAPIPLMVMAFLFPQNVTPLNSLPLLGAVVLWLIVLPLVSLGRWRLDVLRVQTIYGFAHLFCIADMFRGLASEWVPTGSTSVQVPVAQRVRSFMGPYVLITQALTLISLGVGTYRFGLHEFWAAIALFTLSAYVFIPVGVLAMRWDHTITASTAAARTMEKTH